jgi:hypothetical protein
MFDVNAVIRVIERRLIRSLKQLPVLMGSNEGTTETHGTVQWSIYVQGLQALQSAIVFVLEHMLQITLDVSGRQATAEVSFERIRTIDRLQEAQAEQIEIRNGLMKFAAGLQSWEETAIELTGSAPPEGSTPPDMSAFLAGTGASGSDPEQNRRPASRSSEGDEGTLHDQALRIDSELIRWMRDSEEGDYARS